MAKNAGAGGRTIHAEHHHLSWDNARPPAMTVAPGAVVEFDRIDALMGQLTRETEAEALLNLDFERVNPVAGPIHVDGAEPGDALKVTLLAFDPCGWAWTAIIPGFGLLAEDFPAPHLHFWSCDTAFKEPAAFGDMARVPLKPFCGTIGVAPRAPGPHSTIPPYASGGNMDIRDLNIGTERYLPVQVPGALFSIGDPHCAQGDGEVCGTAIESIMGVSVKLELVKDENLKFPRFVTPGPVTRHLDAKGYEVTTGIHPDLMDATKDAVRGMIDRLGRLTGMSADQAYMLCSVCADLRISEVVDQPNWVVSCYLPRLVLD